VRVGWARIGTWIIALLVGAVYGVAGTIAHAYTLGWFPLGLVLALIGSGALVLAVRALTADRWAALASGIGLVLTVVLFSGRGPGGSIVVPDGQLDMLGPVNLGVVWTFALPVLVAIIVLWPERRQVRGADRE
jgi:hypothetical protein